MGKKPKLNYTLPWCCMSIRNVTGHARAEANREVYRGRDQNFVKRVSKCRFKKIRLDKIARDVAQVQKYHCTRATIH